jgi:diguanylate cyclase (GGDEF)-like protein
MLGARVRLRARFLGLRQPPCGGQFLPSLVPAVVGAFKFNPGQADSPDAGPWYRALMTGRHPGGRANNVSAETPKRTADLPAVVPPGTAPNTTPDEGDWVPDVDTAPAPEGSLAELVQPVPPIRPDALGRTVYETFTRLPNLYAVAVVDRAGQPVGVLNRFRFLEALFRPFGMDLYQGRPVESFMDRAPLVVDEYIPLDVVADLLADDTTKYIFDGFIVTRAGRYLGMGTGFGLMRQLTERKQATCLHLANHDVLTDLPNRQLFCDRLDQALARSRASGRPTAVLHLDLDRFKAVNDAFGHSAGDLLLLGVAARLQESVRAQDTVARMGGDEFGVILAELADTHDAEHVAAKLLARCTESHNLEGHEVNVSYSIGIAVFPEDGHSGEALLRAADDAVAHAKEMRNTWQRYSSEMRRAGSSVFSYSYVKNGIDGGYLEPYFQPIVDVRSGRIRSVEALARWRDPVHGLMSTPDLVRFAEESGLIEALSRRIIREAMQAVGQWQRTLVPDLSLAVNVSGVQFRGGRLVQMIGEFLDETGFPPELLDIEITESTVMRLGAATFTALAQLKSLGINLSVDDFGTGYSSLSRLQRLPVDALKIDRSFVQDIDDRERGGELATAIIMMGHSLGLSVTAEGVETGEQLDFLTAEGCDRAQGYLFSRPLAADDLEAYLRQTAGNATVPYVADRAQLA